MIRRIKPKDNANLRNSTGSKNKPITKTGTRDRIPSSNSSVSRSTRKGKRKLLRRFNKIFLAAVDHEARAKILESRVFELEAKLEIKTKKLSRADELVTIIFPKILEKKEQQCGRKNDHGPWRLPSRPALLRRAQRFGAIAGRRGSHVACIAYMQGCLWQSKWSASATTFGSRAQLM